MVEITGEDISADSGAPRKRSRLRSTSFLHDPVALLLVFVIALVIIGALLTAVFAILNGVVNLGSAPPATINQAVVQRAKGAAQSDNDAKSYADLLITQVDNKDIPSAQVTLAQMKNKDFDLTQTQAVDYCQAYIDQAVGRTDSAIKLYQQVMTKLIDAYNTEKAKGGDSNWALSFGVPDNYYGSASLLATLYQQRKDYQNEVKYLTIYLEGNKTDASALLDRGNAYLALKQNDNAKQDFQNALKYIPDNAEATAGLKKAEGN